MPNTEYMISKVQTYFHIYQGLAIKFYIAKNKFTDLSRKAKHIPNSKLLALI